MSPSRDHLLNAAEAPSRVAIARTTAAAGLGDCITATATERVRATTTVGRSGHSRCHAQPVRREEGVGKGEQSRPDSLPGSALDDAVAVLCNVAMRSHRVTIFIGSWGVGKGELSTIAVGSSRLRGQSLRRPPVGSGHLHREEGVTSQPPRAWRSLLLIAT
jgi:hypothetical protein